MSTFSRDFLSNTTSSTTSSIRSQVKCPRTAEWPPAELALASCQLGGQRRLLDHDHVRDHHPFRFRVRVLVRGYQGQQGEGRCCTWPAGERRQTPLCRLSAVRHVRVHDLRGHGIPGTGPGRDHWDAGDTPGCCEAAWAHCCCCCHRLRLGDRCGWAASGRWPRRSNHP